MQAIVSDRLLSRKSFAGIAESRALHDEAFLLEFGSLQGARSDCHFACARISGKHSGRAGTGRRCHSWELLFHWQGGRTCFGHRLLSSAGFLGVKLL